MVLVLLPLGLIAQEEETDAKPVKEKKSSSKVFTGFSGGMLLHGGYLFADDPRTVFSNDGLGSTSYWKGLPKSGLCYGLGGALRCHLINHIHLGAEGYMSTMPLMSTGSNVRTAWGGVLCDFYANWGKVRPMIGLTVGGGAMKRLFVPTDSMSYTPSGTAAGDSTYYNASYVKTPFFCIDPYVGMEIGLGNHVALIFRIDYMLPFNIHNKGLAEVGKQVTWDNFVKPSGPRLYVGIMFGKLKRD
ncbi:MAG: hypothetical protein J6T71_00110 [Paludibacteraceae bacterium]|nr:hypothetical protein [Paludibacteraceae bacterium]